MKLSIITINYNNKEGLRTTIESVVNQTYRDFEYIIIDGGSTDGSVEVIKEYADKIDYWASEPDRGVYPAMNKGIWVARGDYCNFMNSADYFYTNTALSDVFEKINTTTDILCCNCVIYGKTHYGPKEITGLFMFRSVFCHQSTFIRTTLLKDNPYDESFKIVADWKHMFECLIWRNAIYQYLDIDLCVYDEHGLSSNPENSQRLMDERSLFLQSLPKRIYDDYKLLEKSNIYNQSLVFAERMSRVYKDSKDEKIILFIARLFDAARKIKHKFSLRPLKLNI